MMSFVTHKMTSSPTFKTWQSMRQRCENARDTHFKNYGARGIVVCEQWRRFENFFADMGARPDGMTLDRIDVNGNYEPENCRWADSVTQHRNRRDNRIVWANGQRKTIAEWAELLGVPYGRLAMRIRRGWAFAEWTGTKQRDGSKGVGKMKSTITRRGMCRQGDVLLIPVEDAEVVADDVAPAKKDARGLVLAEGETSGHHHAVFGRGAKLMRFRAEARQDLVVIVGRGGAEVRVVGGESGGVPRHHPVQLGPGKYLARVQRQWTQEDEARSRAVAD